MRKLVSNAWLIWFCAGLFYLFEFIHRVIISVMVPELAQSFQSSAIVPGALAAAYFYAYGIAQIPVGILLDKFSTRTILTSASSMIAISSFILSLTSNIHIAIIARAFIGLGSATAFVSCLKLGAQWFSNSKFPVIVGMTNLLGVTGAILSGSPMAYILQFTNWRNLTFSLGIVGIIITALLWVVIRDRHKPGPTASKFKLPTSTNIIIVAIYAGLMVAPIIAYAELWGVSYLVDHYSLPRPICAHIVTSTFVGIGLGGPFIGWLSQYYKNIKKLMLYGLVISIASFSIILSARFNNTVWLYALHILFGTSTSSMLLCFSINSQLVPNEHRSTSIAFTNTIIMVLGAIAQTVCSYVMEKFEFNYFIGLTPLLLGYGLAAISLFFIHYKKSDYV